LFSINTGKVIKKTEKGKNGHNEAKGLNGVPFKYIWTELLLKYEYELKS